MPKITRSQVSLIGSPIVRFIGTVIIVSVLLTVGALYLGFTDKGAINVNAKIRAIDPSTLANPVNANTNGTAVNGGLRPASAADMANVAKPPEPVPTPQPSPASSTASTTAASSAPLHPQNATH